MTTPTRPIGSSSIPIPRTGRYSRAPATDQRARSTSSLGPLSSTGSAAQRSQRFSSGCTWRSAAGQGRGSVAEPRRGRDAPGRPGPARAAPGRARRRGPRGWRSSGSPGRRPPPPWAAWRGCRGPRRCRAGRGCRVPPAGPGRPAGPHPWWSGRSSGKVVVSMAAPRLRSAWSAYQSQVAERQAERGPSALSRMKPASCQGPATG